MTPIEPAWRPSVEVAPGDGNVRTPVVVARGANRYDLFYRQSDGHLHTKWQNSSGQWSAGVTLFDPNVPYLADWSSGCIFGQVQLDRCVWPKCQRQRHLSLLLEGCRLGLLLDGRHVGFAPCGCGTESQSRYGGCDRAERRFSVSVLEWDRLDRMGEPWRYVHEGGTNSCGIWIDHYSRLRA